MIYAGSKTLELNLADTVFLQRYNTSTEFFLLIMTGCWGDIGKQHILLNKESAILYLKQLVLINLCSKFIIVYKPNSVKQFPYILMYWNQV